LCQRLGVLLNLGHLLDRAIAERDDLILDLLAGPIFGNRHIVAVEPVGAIAEVVIPVRLLRVGIFALELVLGQRREDEGDVPIRRVRRGGAGIAVDRERVGDALDNDILLERIVAGIGKIVRQKPKPWPTACSIAVSVATSASLVTSMLRIRPS
jgi:hypothetical protein